MMKTIKLLLIGFLLSINGSHAYAQSSGIRGTVTDAETGQTLPFVNVVLKNGQGVIVAGAATDFDGFYNINPVAVGKYTIEASFTGYSTEVLSQIEVKSRKLKDLNLFLFEDNSFLEEVVITYSMPLIDKTRCCCCCIGTCSYVTYLSGESVSKDQSFALFPNPSYGEINLKSDTKMERVVITNMNGQQVAELKVEDPQELRAHLNLPDGIYLVHLSDGSSKQTQKWVVQ